MKKFFTKAFCFILLCIFILSISLFTPINDNKGGIEGVSFYYRDTINLAEVYSQYVDYSVATDNSQLAINYPYAYLNDPESISPENLHFHFYFSKDDKTIIESAHIRCWINNSIRFEESNPLLNRFKEKRLYRKFSYYWWRLFEKGYNSLLLCQNDTAYYIENSKLKWRTIDNYGILCEDLELDHPLYNQLLKYGNIGMLRTGNKLYLSDDHLRTWELIYNDRRGIKESVCWSPKDSTILFSQYTPGAIRLRHYILSYHLNTSTIDTLQTFYTKDENKIQGLSPYCRHIHLMNVDPFTGDLYIGVGDYEGEPGIYRSQDNGQTLECIGRGLQLWRTLTFIFTKDYIFWTNDSESPQYINRIRRNQLMTLPLDSTDVVRFPIFNSALWCSYRVNDSFYIVSSNSEGCFYDDFHRIYGIRIGEEGIPTVYNLLEEMSESISSAKKYHQLFIIGKDEEDNYLFYDTQKHIVRSLKLVNE